MLARIERCGRLSLVHGPLDPGTVLDRNPVLDAAAPAPAFTDGWSAIRARVTSVLGPLPRDGILVIGETGLEREWSEAGRCAGYLPAERFFGTG